MSHDNFSESNKIGHINIPSPYTKTCVKSPYVFSFPCPLSVRVQFNHIRGKYVWLTRLRLPMDTGNSLYGLAYPYMNVMCQVYITCSLVHYCSLQDQRSALYYATEGGHHDTVRVLLQRGVRHNKQTNVGGV